MSQNNGGVFEVGCDFKAQWRSVRRQEPAGLHRF